MIYSPCRSNCVTMSFPTLSWALIIALTFQSPFTTHYFLLPILSSPFHFLPPLLAFKPDKGVKDKIATTFTLELCAGTGGIFRQETNQSTVVVAVPPRSFSLSPPQLEADGWARFAGGGPPQCRASIDAETAISFHLWTAPLFFINAWTRLAGRWLSGKARPPWRSGGMAPGPADGPQTWERKRQKCPFPLADRRWMRQRCAFIDRCFERVLEVFGKFWKFYRLRTLGQDLRKAVTSAELCFRWRKGSYH